MMTLETFRKGYKDGSLYPKNLQHVSELISKQNPRLRSVLPYLTGPVCMVIDEYDRARFVQVTTVELCVSKKQLFEGHPFIDGIPPTANYMYLYKVEERSAFGTAVAGDMYEFTAHQFGDRVVKMPITQVAIDAETSFVVRVAFA